MKLSERSIFLVFLALAITVTFAYFGPFLHNFFLYDDFGIIELVLLGTKAVLLGYNYTLRFTTNLTWIPLFALSGLDPFGYNLFSLLLWLLNAILAYRFLHRLLGDPLPAALAGLIFVSTAVGADAALWRAANGTLIDVTFYLLTLHAYTVYRQTDAKRQWWLSVFYFVLAFFSKEEAASLPLLVLLLEWLYFDGRSDVRGVMRRFLTYSSIIGASVLMNYIVIYHIMHVQSELVKLTKFRPLHSLFSGWTVFFLSPDGRLTIDDPRIYLTAALILLSFFVVKDRRLLIFGLGWVFLSFLPQSLSFLSQFKPVYPFSSLSRHLYLPSIGAAIAYVAVIVGLRERFSQRVAVAAAAIFLVLFIPYNYCQVTARAITWQEGAEPTKVFLDELQQRMPQIPPNTYVYVENTPVGRAYMQQALRVFYKNSTITWIIDPDTFHPKPGETAVVINCDWQPNGNVFLRFFPLI